MIGGGIWVVACAAVASRSNDSIQRTQDQNVCVIHVPKLDFSYSQSPDFKRLCPNPDVHPDDDLHFRRGVVQHFREVFHLCFCAAEDLGCSAIKVPGMSISYFSRKFTLVCNISQWMCLQTFVCVCVCVCVCVNIVHFHPPHPPYVLPFILNLNLKLTCRHTESSSKTLLYSNYSLLVTGTPG